MTIWRWLRRRREEDDLDDEIRAHLEMAARDRIARGESDRDAREAARKEFGNVLLVKEITREMWGWASFERLVQDVRYATRTLRRNPAFVGAALLSLGLGIGANTAAFSLADAALFRPLPVTDSDHVVVVAGRTPRANIEQLSYPDFSDLRRQARSFEDMVAARTARVALARASDPVPQMRFALLVSEGFFDVLGVPSAVGRRFTRAEGSHRAGAQVAMLSYESWQTHFAGSPDVVGSAVRINGMPVTIVGVVSQSFTGLNQFLRPALYLPLGMTESLTPTTGPSLFDRRDDTPLMVRARLQRGVSLAEAHAEIRVLGDGLRRAYPDTNRNRSFVALSEFQARAREAPANVAVMSLLLGLAALVLFIACANVASLQLARARSRSREIALRLAIGAGRVRLLRQLITESLVLALAGGAAGVALAAMAIRALASIQLPTDTPIGVAVRLDGRVLAASVAVALVSAVLFGLVPAWRTAGTDLVSALKASDLTTGSRMRLWGRQALVAGQIAICALLLVVSGALLDAFGKMLLIDPGIRGDRIMMAEFDPSLVGYDAARTRQFYDALLERVRGLSGVRSATLAGAIPFRPNFSNERIVPEGYQLPAGETSVVVPVSVIDHAYFDTIGTAVVHGRAFTREDDTQSPAVAIVNETLADRYWTKGDALGKRLFLGQREPVEIVGIARTAKYVNLAEAPQPYLYVPVGQRPSSRMTLLARAEGSPASLAAPMLAIVRSLDPNQPVFNVRDFRTYFEQGALGLPRILVQMASIAGLVGLKLALAGIYGLVSYSVSRRTREFGVRMAIGANRRDVLTLVLREALRLALAGAIAGLALGIPIFRLLSARLSGLGGLDMATLVVVPLLLIIVALGAAYMPARRATQVNPTIALRAE